jgi:hypothetical protein
MFNKNILFAGLFAGLSMTVSAHAADTAAEKDAHYTATGFFDIHLCDWPGQPPFYLALYSTEQFDAVASVHIFDARGDSLGSLDLSRYRIIEKKNKPVKHAFITQFAFQPGAADGWFTAEIRLKDGTRYRAQDRVVHTVMPRVQMMQPKNHAELAALPHELSWEKIAGARFYRVFIRDTWDNDKQIYSSAVINENHLQLPDGLLEPGGSYSWRVHARDVNEDVELGDFNAGSLSVWAEFSIPEH